MKKAFLFLSCVFVTALSAALPPLAQSANEIQALLSDSEFQAAFSSGEAIQAILRTSTGYIVMTKHSCLRADVEYLQQAMPGPKPFRFHIYPPIELE